MGEKRKLIAYLLWAVGGMWGLHHIYLGRYRQAFLWMTTLGGFLGLGWVRDVWRMPDYVAQANADTDYVERFVEMIKQHWRPSLSMTRISAETGFGTLAGIALVAGLPQDLILGPLGHAVMAALVPLVTGLAVHLVGNIGRESAALKWALGGAYVGSVLLSGSVENAASSVSQSALGASLAVNWKGKSWRRTKYRRFSCTLCLGLVTALIVYNGLWFSGLYHNAYIITNNSDKVPLRDAFAHIMMSEAWRHPLNTLRHIWATYGASGFTRTWREFVTAMDPEGENTAYQVLGVRAGADEKELKSAYRDLVKIYHPDRTTDPDKRAEHQTRFMEIQKAFETLSGLSNRRARASKRSRDQDNRSL